MKGSVYKRGATWTAHVNMSQDGQRRQAKRGGFRTKREAEDALRRLIDEMERAPALATERLTVADYLTEWLDHRVAMRSLKASTVQSYRSKIGTYIVPAVGAVPLRKLDARHLDALYRGMASKGLSARSIRYVHALIRKALHDAVRGGLIPTNAADRANPPSSSAARAPKFRVWTPGELATFLSRVESSEYGPAIRFAAMTGARRAEVCALRWGDLDLEAGVATIRRSVTEIAGGRLIESSPKSGRERAVALDPATVAALKRHRAEQAAVRLMCGASWHDTDLVFPLGDGRPMRPDVLSNAFRRLATTAGVPRIRLHDLRHGHATVLVEAGVDPATVSSRLGHATTQFTLDVYVKPSVERQAQAAQIFADRIAR